MAKDEHKETSVKEESRKRIADIARKLSVTVPAGLFLLANMNVVSTSHASVGATGAEIQKMQNNQVSDKLLGYAKKGIEVASASNCGGIHGDQHVNTNDPNIKVNGKHSNVHTNQHGDSCRY